MDRSEDVIHIRDKYVNRIFRNVHAKMNMEKSVFEICKENRRISAEYFRIMNSLIESKFDR